VHLRKAPRPLSARGPERRRRAAAGTSRAIWTSFGIQAGWQGPALWRLGSSVFVRILVVAAALTAIRGGKGPGIASIAELIRWAVLVPTVAIFGAAWQAQGVACAMVISALAGLLAIAIGIATSTHGPQRMVASATTIAPSQECF
jgi:hypothetical protein